MQFIISMSFTDQGIRTIKDAPKRTQAARELAKKLGVEIKQLYLEFQAAGVTFAQTLKREPWGARDFIVRDPDGNLLLFAGPAQ